MQNTCAALPAGNPEQTMSMVQQKKYEKTIQIYQRSDIKQQKYCKFLQKQYKFLQKPTKTNNKN